ncbi:hypothetical protein [Dysgonomonas macrotermitis]|uniref:Uncharacterized protein n=1 Tax=Dysgonomonas macrotermitis TaxID=1346286 RepID=A0A1M5I2S3_9BACT|nr:hypothetical protein [Dysgonomonas macrotermitis]SHG22467.1 hypothetical protein SAMN05444362_11817 [Dysgonomonas macrotermitis]
MEIKNIEGLSINDIQNELDRGARFVIFNYCVSLLVITFKRGSSIYFIKSNESAFAHHWKHTGLSLVMGWWGIPWGPIYTIQSLWKNMTGGTDVTNEVIAALNPQPDLDNLKRVPQ